MEKVYTIGLYPNRACHRGEAAKLAVEMCSPWFESVRDADSEQLQYRIHCSSVQAANASLPREIEAYLRWRVNKGIAPDLTQAHRWTVGDFFEMREFISTVAKLNMNIWLYYDVQPEIKNTVLPPAMLTRL